MDEGLQNAHQCLPMCPQHCESDFTDPHEDALVSSDAQTIDHVLWFGNFQSVIMTKENKTLTEHTKTISQFLAWVNLNGTNSGFSSCKPLSNKQLKST